MIISHSKQVNFWKIPRTGSSNVEMVLRLIGGLDTSQDVIAETHFFPQSYNFSSMPARGNVPGPRRAHITPATAIAEGFLTQAQYDSYENYCMVRDPVDKFISLHSLAFPREKFEPNNIWANIRSQDPSSAIFRPQSDYLSLGNITALPFSDYENSVRTIITAFGVPQPDAIPKVTRENPGAVERGKAIATAPQRAEIEALYPDDMLLNF